MQNGRWCFYHKNGGNEMVEEILVKWMEDG